MYGILFKSDGDIFSRFGLLYSRLSSIMEYLNEVS